MSASTVGTVGMLLRIGRHRDFEIAVDALDAGDQIGGVAIAARMRRVLRARAADRIAAQRHDVAHAGVVIIAHDGVDVGAGRGDASQMRGRRQRRFRQDALDRRVRALARRAAGAVGDRDEIRRERRQALDRLPQDLLHLLARWAGRIRTTRRCGGPRRGRSGWRGCSSRHLPLRRLRHQRADVAREPQRHRDLAVGAGLGG